MVNVADINRCLLYSVSLWALVSKSLFSFPVLEPQGQRQIAPQALAEHIQSSSFVATEAKNLIVATIR